MKFYLTVAARPKALHQNIQAEEGVESVNQSDVFNLSTAQPAGSKQVVRA
jgi:hypothetical protein